MPFDLIAPVLEIRVWKKSDLSVAETFAVTVPKVKMLAYIS